jgi:hypothetical protein
MDNQIEGHSSSTNDCHSTDNQIEGRLSNTNDCHNTDNQIEGHVSSTNDYHQTSNDIEPYMKVVKDELKKNNIASKKMAFDKNIDIIVSYVKECLANLGTKLYSSPSSCKNSLCYQSGWCSEYISSVIFELEYNKKVFGVDTNKIISEKISFDDTEIEYKLVRSSCNSYKLGWSYQIFLIIKVK